MSQSFPVFPDGPDRPYYLKCFKCGRREPLTHYEYHTKSKHVRTCPTCGAEGYEAYGPTFAAGVKSFMESFRNAFKQTKQR